MPHRTICALPIASVCVLFLATRVRVVRGGSRVFAWRAGVLALAVRGRDVSRVRTIALQRTIVGAEATGGTLLTRTLACMTRAKHALGE